LSASPLTIRHSEFATARTLTLKVAGRHDTGNKRNCNSDVDTGFQYPQQFGRRINWQVDGSSSSSKIAIMAWV
jgi:hypothetical protein